MYYREIILIVTLLVLFLINIAVYLFLFLERKPSTKPSLCDTCNNVTCQDCPNCSNCIECEKVNCDKFPQCVNKGCQTINCDNCNKVTCQECPSCVNKGCIDCNTCNNVTCQDCPNCSNCIECEKVNCDKFPQCQNKNCINCNNPPSNVLCSVCPDVTNCIDGSDTCGDCNPDTIDCNECRGVCDSCNVVKGSTEVSINTWVGIPVDIENGYVNTSNSINSSKTDRFLSKLKPKNREMYYYYGDFDITGKVVPTAIAQGVIDLDLSDLKINDEFAIYFQEINNDRTSATNYVQLRSSEGKVYEGSDESVDLNTFVTNGCIAFIRVIDFPSGSKYIVSISIVSTTSN